MRPEDDPASDAWTEYPSSGTAFVAIIVLDEHGSLR